MTTFLMLCLPALLAIFSSFIQKEYLMFIAFILSLPISFYLFGTPGLPFVFCILHCLFHRFPSPVFFQEKQSAVL